MDTETPAYPSPYLLGQTIEVQSFAFTNPQGGTEFAKQRTLVKLITRWWDYETGWHYWAMRDNQRVFIDQGDPIPPAPAIRTGVRALDDRLIDVLWAIKDDEGLDLASAEQVCTEALALIPVSKQPLVTKLNEMDTIPGVSHERTRRFRLSSQTQIAYSLLETIAEKAKFVARLNSMIAAKESIRFGKTA